MTRPDPRSDLMGYLDWLGDRIETALSLRDAAALLPGQAEKALARSKGSLCAARYPWRIPEHGAKGPRHSLATWRAWLETPERERRAEWDALTRKQRRTIKELV